MLLLEKGTKGGIRPEYADRLASVALAKKEAATTQAVTGSQNLAGQDKMVAQLESNVKKLKSQISTWENELTTLRARSKVASATKKLNQQLAKTSSDSTVAMLEKMKSKVQEDEALAESYGEIAMVETNIDMEINKALEGDINPKTSDSLAELKKKMGLEK
jgi:phage shock protein A